MIIIISFRYIFEKLIIIKKKSVNDLNIFYITFIVKIKVVFVIISRSKITINEICDVIFVKNDFCNFNNV